MANPIIPAGRFGRRLVPGALYSSDVDDDIFLAARRQDEERAIREDDDHFRTTGENRPPRGVDDPLVDNDVNRDVADDGDSYDEPIQYFRRQHTADGEWAEDTPTRIINQRVADDLRALHGIDASRELEIINGIPPRQLSNVLGENSSRILESRREREAYLRREQEKKDQEQKVLEEKNKRKYNNAISGLEASEE